MKTRLQSKNWDKRKMTETTTPEVLFGNVQIWECRAEISFLLIRFLFYGDLPKSHRGAFLCYVVHFVGVSLSSSDSCGRRIICQLFFVLTESLLSGGIRLPIYVCVAISWLQSPFTIVQPDDRNSWHLMRRFGISFLGWSRATRHEALEWATSQGFLKLEESLTGRFLDSAVPISVRETLRGCFRLTTASAKCMVAWRFRKNPLSFYLRLGVVTRSGDIPHSGYFWYRFWSPMEINLWWVHPRAEIPFCPKSFSDQDDRVRWFITKVEKSSINPRSQSSAEPVRTRKLTFRI